MKAQNLSAVWRLAGEVMQEIRKWIIEHDKIDLFMNYKPEDQARLLRLLVWSHRFGVPISEILDIVVPPLREQMDLHRRKKRYGLGFSAAILTGHTAERILSIIVGRRYPQGEQFSAINELARERQLEVEKLDELDGLQPKEKKGLSLLETDDLARYVELYSHQVMEIRKTNRNEGAVKWRRRKAYRGNPWHY